MSGQAEPKRKPLDFSGLLQNGSSLFDLTLSQSLIFNKETPFQFVSHVVKLNIGGRLYTTSKETLTKQNNTFFTQLFEKMQSGMSPTVDEMGYIFIDRTGEPFYAILEFLRTGQLTQRSREIQCEADFYRIKLPPPSLAESIRAKQPLWDSFIPLLERTFQQVMDYRIKTTIAIPCELLDQESVNRIKAIGNACQSKFGSGKKPDLRIDEAEQTVTLLL